MGYVVLMKHSLHDDERWMRVALAYAQRVRGQTMPNPAVGCVLVKDGVLLAGAHTAPSGRPHAETQALALAGDAARGATAYVTLEPCAHVGRTGACAQALIDAQVARVVIAVQDVDARVQGRGVQMLRDAGIVVMLGVCEAEATMHHAPFFSRVQRNIPQVSLKIATSLDGCIANAHAQSQWVTGEAARQYGQYLRATHDAIVTGIGTVLADNPQLTCRLNGREAASPVRVVVDTQLRIPEDAALVATAKHVPVWILTGRDVDGAKAARLRDAGVQVMCADTTHLSCVQIVHMLAAQGVSSVLVEAGQRLSTAMMDAGVVDALYWFRAPLVIGVGGLRAFALDGGRALDEMERFQLQHIRKLGADVLEFYSAAQQS